VNKNEEIKIRNIAEEYFRAGNCVLAHELLQKVIRANPKSASANELSAYIAGNSGNIKQAHQLLRLPVARPIARLIHFLTLVPLTCNKTNLKKPLTVL
jgi:Tfp pilus assembly protein PilF